MQGAATRSLGNAIESLPAECYDNPTWRGVAWIVRDLAVYAALVATLVYVETWYLLVPLWAITGLAISGLFILGHDAAHGALFKSKRLNYLTGQFCMLPSLHLYEAWVFGHNRIHHGHTTRQVMDYVWHPVTPDEYAALSPIGKLAHHVKWSWIGAGVYYGHDIWWKQMIRFRGNDKLAPLIRRDRIVVGSYALLSTVAVIALGAYWYGTASGALWMVAKVLLVPFVAWNFSIGMAVYVHHIGTELPWHKRREWTKYKGQVEGTTVLHAPFWLNFFYHNIMLHVPHHVDMRIPFYRLPVAVDVLRTHLGDAMVERDYRLRDYLRTTRSCKLFDFETGEWHTYRSARSLPVTEAEAAA